MGLWLPKSALNEDPKPAPPPVWQTGESHESKCDVCYGNNVILTVRKARIPIDGASSDFAQRLVVIFNAAGMKP